MDKTKYETKQEVQTSMALPKTLQAELQMTKIGEAEVAMFPVYGRDMTERRIWTATFLDRDEALAWIQASKVFGRPVNGAVIAQQEETKDGTGSTSGEPAEKPN